METDSNTLLEWIGTSNLKDLQEMAIEQFCGLLLMTENYDACLQTVPPYKFVPALCAIFLDLTSPNSLLELAARAITYYFELNVLIISKYVSDQEDAVRAICNCLVITSDGSTIALAEQCVKLLENLCIHHIKVFFKVGGVENMLAFIKNHGNIVHKDTLHSAIKTISTSSRSFKPQDFQTKGCLKDLTELLLHKDEIVANRTLNVFHSLACEYDKLFLDTTEIAEYGLLKSLTTRLIAAADSSAASTQDVVSNAAAESNSKIIATIFQIYSFLCRGSASITYELIQSNFLDVIEKVLKLNENSVLELIKFVYDLLDLLCGNGVNLKEKNANASTVTLASAEELYVDIIESIRLQEFGSFMTCLENPCIDINYMDSDGQTLMNWASALGTAEMVEALCMKGADFTKGEHGSSLHYAVSREKIDTVQILIKYGASPYLKDENGKTPIDIATDINSFVCEEIASKLNKCQFLWNKNLNSTESKAGIVHPTEEDNWKMASVYLQRLLPIFCTTFQSTTFNSVHKATLKSIKFMVRYIESSTLKELCTFDVGGQKFAIQMADTIVTAFNDADNDELMVLNIIESLLEKCPELFLDAFARLGISLQVQNLIALESDEVVVVKEAETAKTLQDATELLRHKPYNWHHWCICLSPTGFYAWCESAILEFCNNSNGWFRCFINGKLHTMYSCGLAENESTAINPLEFLTKFNRACHEIVMVSSTPILSNPGSTSLVVNNWSIVSPIETELHIQNLENPQQKTTLSLNVHGFRHESDNGSEHSFTTKRYVVPKDAGGWLKKFQKVPTEKKRKMEIERLSCSIYRRYLKTSEIQKRSSMVTLENVVMQIKFGSSDEILKNSFDELTQLLMDDDRISVYELYNSGLVQALLLLLEQQKGVQLFRQCFEEKSTNGNMFALLVQKLIAVLENTEKLRVNLFHTQNAVGYGVLKALSNPFELVLEREPGEDHLIDRTNYRCHAEPLSTVKELEDYLSKMVIKRNSSGALKKGESAIASGSDVPKSAVSSEVSNLDTSALEPGTVLDTAASGSGTVAPSAGEMADLNPSASEASVIPELGEVMDVDTPASESQETSVSDTLGITSDAVPKLTVASGSEIVNSNIPTSETIVISGRVVHLKPYAAEFLNTRDSRAQESRIASGSGVVELNPPTTRSKKSRKKPQKTILENILTDGDSNVTSQSPAAIKEATVSSDEYSSDSSSEEDEAQWNRNFVLKAQLPALIPAFDPRQGRQNVNPTTNFDVPPPGPEEFTINSKDDSRSPRKIQLILKNFTSTFEMELNDSNSTIFRAIMELTQSAKFEPRQQINKIWYSSYKIGYREVKNSDLSPKPSHSTPNSKIGDILQLLKHLLAITTSKKVSPALALTPSQFSSEKINKKLLQQMKDSLIMSCSSAPAWCEEFIHSFSFLFPFETRQLYFQSTAFGTTRSVMWFQSQNDISVERLRASAMRYDRQLVDFQFGRLTTERIRVPRGDAFLRWAMEVMKVHCDRKTKLEIQFVDEEGTGLGPTLEFYALAAAELQRRDLAMWICDDLLDVDEDTPGYYIRNQSGLFPAPLPQDSPMCDEAVKYFWFLGVLLAKALQDNRLVDLPLSNSFLKLMCHRNTKTPDDEKTPWYHAILGLYDLNNIDPIRAQFLKEIQKLGQQRTVIMQDASLSSDSKRSLIQNLKVNDISLEDLALNFTYAPSSKIFGISAMELVPNGADIDVTVENIDEYFDLTLSFALEKGIARQLKAFHQGFSEVFRMTTLAVFNPTELRVILCGDQNPQWTKEDLLSYTEARLGYTKESPGFLRFVNVLMDISPKQKKAFLQFATGCSSLPPGGLANLHPRLMVVKKIDAGEGSYPSVNTCVHYLKLPEYSTEEILKERLLTAIKETGFHFN